MYEDLRIKTKVNTTLPYTLTGQAGSACSDIKYSGDFFLEEKTANSFFITNEGVLGFIDDNDKAIDGVRVR